MLFLDHAVVKSNWGSRENKKVGVGRMMVTGADSHDLLGAGVEKRQVFSALVAACGSSFWRLMAAPGTAVAPFSK